MNSWSIKDLDIHPSMPHILSSSADARVIALHLVAGERLEDHQVHERAWVVVVSGDVEISTADTRLSGGPGLLVEFDPQERHEVAARADTRLLLLLTPWPGAGHPGTMTLEEKASVRERAARR